MKITFFSNYLNHHQLPFCFEMKKILGENFKFVATSEISHERLELGYKDLNNKYDFVIREYENPQLAYKLAVESDIVLLGSAPFKYVKVRCKHNKVTIRYNERPFKSGVDLKRFIYYGFYRKIYERKNVYMLCASAYTRHDFNITGLYKNKCYKWGYFPKTIEYKDIDSLLNSKIKNTIIWVGRFIEFKHPEIMIELAKKLKEKNIDFTINMIGIGVLKDEIETRIKDNNLENNIFLLGSMSSDDVRKYMEKSKIFLFTSDKKEGWGAVLNEAMNSACVPIVNYEVGSAPFLIRNNVNGIIFDNDHIEEIVEKISMLFQNEVIYKQLAFEAYLTITNVWNSKVAANRFLELSKNLLDNIDFDKYIDGPCSKAFDLKDNWFKETNKEETKK